MNEKKTQKKIRQKKKGLNRVLSPIVVFLFLLMVHMFINFDMITYAMNQDSYEEVTAVVAGPTTDKFLLLIPMAEIRYEYAGTEYEETKYFFLEPLFGLSSESGTQLPIYVNKAAPSHSLFKVHFFLNLLNLFLLILEVVCIYNVQKRIREGISVWKKGRKKRKKEGTAHESETDYEESENK